MHKHKTALFIGRFQPFHNGHLYSLNKCREIAESVIVGIGSSQESGTPDNPWDYEVRRRMVEAIDNTLKIIAIPDTPTDKEWLEEVVKLVGDFDIVVSNNDWVLQIMRGAGYNVLESGFFDRDRLEGVKIRELMRRGDNSWKSRVPKEVLEEIDMSAIRKSNPLGF